MRVVVIGSGVIGAWCAKFLAEAGHTVALIDAYGPANGRASSSDHSRVIRAGYGRDDIYSRWAMRSLREWQWLAAATNQSLLVRTGALFLGAADNEYIQATFNTLASLGIAAELLGAEDAARRFPQLSMAGLGHCLYEAQAGVIRARAAVQTLVRHLVATHRVSYTIGRVAPADEQRSELRLHTTEGEAIAADVTVFACGPWLPGVLPQAIGARIRATRQEVLYFGVPAGDSRFSAPHLPVWIDFTAGLYGIPDLDARGFKVGVDRHGEIVDPDTHERLIAGEIVSRTREWIAQRFPGMANAPFVDGHVCQYENSSSGDFIIDRHPHWPNAWIVGGGSGHGFKHGPAIGRHVAELIDGKAAVQSRFALSNRGTTAERTVY